jgi:hypothetical protein
MDLDIFLQILEKYDLPTIILGAAFFVYIKRKLIHVDQAGSDFESRSFRDPSKS